VSIGGLLLLGLLATVSPGSSDGFGCFSSDRLPVMLAGSGAESPCARIEHLPEQSAMERFGPHRVPVVPVRLAGCGAATPDMMANRRMAPSLDHRGLPMPFHLRP
jgi:hypothetical protein